MRAAYVTHSWRVGRRYVLPDATRMETHATRVDAHARCTGEHVSRVGSEQALYAGACEAAIPFVLGLSLGACLALEEVGYGYLLAWRDVAICTKRTDTESS